MYSKNILLGLAFSAAAALAQQVGTLTTETHPKLTIKQCTASKVCTEQSKSIVLDANWRWLHSVGSSTNCYTGNKWDSSLCPSPSACATNCALDGADYTGTYGITTSGNALKLVFVTNGPYSKNIGSRVYLLDDDSNYKKFDLRNQEFTLDVDVSNLPCGLNGAVYFVEMDKDGGKAKYSTNKAGAKYGTGYCDSQCPHDIKFINGAANTQNWTPSDNDANSGKGHYGSCCSEMDIWEANSQATAYTPHVCTTTGQSQCEGTACGDGDQRYDGVCDKDGCDFNSWRMGNQTFYGQGKTIDTTKPFTVVTQFIGSGTLTEIRRLYVQNGKTYTNSMSKVSGVTATNSITDSFCAQQKTAFGDNPSFANRGGMKAMGDSFSRGMVLTLSVWDDHDANMLWLDSNYPTTGSATKPGVSRGPCATTSGKPADVESQYPGASVTYSNIRFGPIGSTY